MGTGVGTTLGRARVEGRVKRKKVREGSIGCMIVGTTRNTKEKRSRPRKADNEGRDGR